MRPSPPFDTRLIRPYGPNRGLFAWPDAVHPHYMGLVRVLPKRQRGRTAPRDGRPAHAGRAGPRVAPTRARRHPILTGHARHEGKRAGRRQEKNRAGLFGSRPVAAEKVRVEHWKRPWGYARSPAQVPSWRVFPVGGA